MQGSTECGRRFVRQMTDATDLKVNDEPGPIRRRGAALWNEVEGVYGAAQLWAQRRRLVPSLGVEGDRLRVTTRQL